MILIKDGRVIDPKSGTDEKLDIIIKDGLIADMGKFPKGDEYEKVIDAKGKIVAPGLVDIHVHFRDPGYTYKEDIESGARAAAAGGYTTVVCMANTNPVVDSKEVLEDLIRREESLPVQVFNTAAVTVGLKGKELTDMETLKAAGAIGFTDDGMPIGDVKLVLEAMKQAGELGVPISFHEEDANLLGSAGVNEGAVSQAVGVAGASSLAEETLIARDCLLARKTGATINIQHISSRVSVELIRMMKKLGVKVWAEVTPQHFSLTEEAVLERGALAKVNPEAYLQIRSRLDERILADLEANNQFWDRYEGKVADAAEAVNDTYLKANRQEHGVASYGMVVDLMLGWYGQMDN